MSWRLQFMNKEMEKDQKINIPEGKFCGGNCIDCVYYEPQNKDSSGRGYCNYYNTHYYPSERNGCLSRREY